jgi:hypothetical protein
MGKITDNELQRIQLVKRDAIEVATALGELEFQRITIELLIEQEKEKIKDIKKREQQIFLELKETYGTISINIETGEFN